MCWNPLRWRGLSTPAGAVSCLSVAGLAGFLWIYRGLLTGSALVSHDSIAWFGEFHYYVRWLAAGVFPYWDPFTIGGTPFYPNVAHLGLLDPTVLFWTALVRFAGLAPLRGYVYFLLLRLGIFGLGSYLLFRRATKCRAAALFGAAVLVLGLSPSYFSQVGIINVVWLAPLSMTFLLGAFRPASPRPTRALCALALAVTTGVAVNVYIPAFHLFNLLCFAAVAAGVGILSPAEVLASCKDRRNWPAGLGALGLFGLLCLPQAAVYFKDLSVGGELFPVLRLLQRNGWTFKELMATRMDVAALSSALHFGVNTFIRLGDLPDFLFHDSKNSMKLYLGIGPLLFLSFGIVFSKGRYRAAAVLLALVMAANTLASSTSLDEDVSFNAVQRMFNWLFPPLRMIRVREVLVSYVALYLGLLSALGMRELLRGGRAGGPLRGTARAVAALPVLLLIAKVAVALVLQRKPLLTPADAAVSGGLALAGLVLLAGPRGGPLRRGLTPGLALLALADLLGYNAASGPGRVVLGPGNPTAAAAEELAALGDRSFATKTGFTWFREPFPRPPYFGFAFLDAVLNQKCLFSFGMNHTVFTTKRHYDLLTHAPLENQFVLGGLALPLARFHPSRDASVVDRDAALRGVISAPPALLAERLYAEPADAPPPRLEAVDAKRAPDVLRLHRTLVSEHYARFRSANAGWLEAVRADPRSVLDTPSSSVDVRSFSPNSVTFRVTNSEPGYLSYADGWSRYWEARVNGRPAPLFVANYNGKAVFLPPGRHEVSLVFNPVHYRVALWAYHGALALGALWLALAVRPGRLPRPPGRLLAGADRGGAGLLRRPATEDPDAAPCSR